MEQPSGKLGEDHVVSLLTQQGFEILEQNYHSRFGEIDIIAENEKYIVFVEVKTREKDGLTTPLEAITPSKQRKIIMTAQRYLQENPSLLQPRFDAAAVLTQGKTIVDTQYIESAFLT